jgi:hypothetical protein
MKSCLNVIYGGDLNEQHISIASDCLKVINNIHDGVNRAYGALLNEITTRGPQFYLFQSHFTSDASIILRHIV